MLVNTPVVASHSVTRAVLHDTDAHIRDVVRTNAMIPTVTRRSHAGRHSIRTCALMTQIGNPIPRRTPLAFLPFRDVLTWDAGMSVTQNENGVDWMMTLTKKVVANYRQSRIRHRPHLYIIHSPALQDLRRHRLQVPLCILHKIPLRYAPQTSAWILQLPLPSRRRCNASN